MKEGKIILEAFFKNHVITEKRKKEIAATLNLPANNQDDLLFMSAILVSTGTNKNGATFLGSELIKARNSIVSKALDIEHKEQKVIGHICSCVFMDYNGNIVDDSSLYEKINSSEAEKASLAVAEVDKLSLDIGIVCVVYKDRFKDIAEEIKDGKWKVSMECYYEDFDIKIGDQIISRDSLDDNVAFIVEGINLNEDIRLVNNGNQLSSNRISRVLRNIRFCGCGIVENPAEDRAVILEAANHIKKVIDREGLTSNSSKEVDLNGASTTKSPLSEDLLDGEVVQLQQDGYLILKDGKLLEDSFFLEYNSARKEAVRRTSIAKQLNKNTRYSIVSILSEFGPRNSVDLNESSNVVVFKTDEGGSITEITDIGCSSVEEAQVVGSPRGSKLSGPASKFGAVDSQSGICINFRKYKYEYPGRTSPGKILATHWCKLLEKPCPVLGADAHDESCLRNKVSRNTKFDHIHGDKVWPTPFNTTVDAEDTVFIKAEDLPQPLSESEILSSKKDEYSPTESTPDKTSVISAPIAQNTHNDAPDGIKVADESSVPTNPLPIKKSVDLDSYDPIGSFPFSIASITREERSRMKDHEFALPSKRKYPIVDKSGVAYWMREFSNVCSKIQSTKDKKEIFNNLIKASLKYGVNTDKFEYNNTFKFKAGEDYDEDFGLPRLELFPLSSRSQVLAAISRFPFMKAEISETEKDRLIINILRAAKKFDIDTTKFRERFFTKE